MSKSDLLVGMPWAEAFTFFIYLVTFCVMILLLSVIMYTVPLGRYVTIVINHYKNNCAIYTRPPPGHDKKTPDTKYNDDPVFGCCRMTALLVQYILFLMVGFFALVLLIQVLFGMPINDILIQDIVEFVFSTSWVIFVLLLFWPILIINPISDAVFWKLISRLQTSTIFDEDSKRGVVRTILNKIEFKELLATSKTATAPVFLYYLSAKILILICVGINTLQGGVSFNPIYLSFVFAGAFLMSCRLVSLQEMHDCGQYK